MKVFLSSTYEDLKGHRERATQAIQRLGDDAVRMEVFGARPETPTVASLQEVQKCDLFLGIYAHRYGFIPEGSNLSITEMEYDEATRCGKPRFCYLVEEDYPWQSSYVAENEAKAKLLQFRSKLLKETVRDTFTTPDDLAFKVATALGHFLRHSATQAPPAWDELVQRWTAEEENARSTYRFQVLESREPLMRLNTLEALWKRFLLSTPWHEDIASRIEELKADAEGDPVFGALLATLFALDTRTDYPLLRDRLASAIPVDAGKILGPTIKDLEKKTGLYGDDFEGASGDRVLVAELKRLKRIRAKLRALGEAAREPQFSRCLLVAGDLGSGKSHLLTYLDPDLQPPAAEISTEQRILAGPRSFLLWLRPMEDLSRLSKQILDLVRKITNFPWSNLEQLDQHFTEIGRDMHSGPPKLILLVDDFHRWIRGRETALQDFEAWIARTTHLACLHWVIALPATSYSELAGRESFWRPFSILEASESGTHLRSEVARSTSQPIPKPILQAGGWIGLDELNQRERLGQRLVWEYIERYRPEDLSLLAHLDQDSLQARHLSTPQIAWILLDFIEEEEIRTLVNLHFIGFVERFWQKRWFVLKRESAQGPLPDQDQIRLVARVLLEECSPYVMRSRAVAVIASRAEKLGDPILAQPERAADVLTLLAKAGLLEVSDTLSPGPEKIALRAPFFWYFQVAASTFETFAAGADDLDIDSWLGTVMDRDAREGIFEFLLLFADRRFSSTEEGLQRVEHLWRQTAGNPALPNSALWLTATKASLSMQIIAARWAQEQGPVPEDPREVFTFVVFLGEVHPSALAPSACLAVLQRMVSTIGAAKLQEYFLFVVAKIFERITSREEWLRSLPFLAGCEPLGVTSSVGRLVADSAGRICDGDIDALLQLLLSHLPAEPVRLKEPSQNKEGANRILVREWIVFHILDRVRALGESRGLDASEVLGKLRAISWYRPERLGIVPQVGGEMERDANSVLGFFYRSQRKELRDRYVEALKGLAYSSNVRDRRLAFFLILHTEPTGDRDAVVIGRSFWPLLEKIFVDRERTMQRVVDDYFGVFRQSLPDFNDLLRRRKPQRRKK